MPHVKVTETLKASIILSPEPGKFILDFGQNFTGWIRLKASNSKNNKVFGTSR